MLFITILNKCYKFKSFVYSKVRYYPEKQEIEIDIVPRSNSHPLCSKCHKPAPGYDTAQAPRRFEFIPILNIRIFFVYFMRRIQCDTCGVVIEFLPWANGKKTLTIPFMLFLANWAKALSWKETADRFRTSWHKVFQSIEYVVEWGLSHRSLDGITAIGIDEIAYKLGHVYLTLVYQLDSGCKRLLWIAQDRTVRSLLGFFRGIGRERCALIKYVCSDMWKPYLKVIKRKVSQAIHILDRFHLIQKMNKAIDEVRAAEHRRLNTQGHETLKHTRWCLLKRRENLTEKQEVKLNDLLRYNLQSVRAYLLKEDFQGFWEYVSSGWAGKFLDRWIGRVLRSRIEPLKKVARTIRNHKALILNWFQAKQGISTGVVEGFNNKIKVTTRKSYGFRTYKCIEIALYHVLGKLPEPILTHRFF
jgi:transposase